MPTDEEIRARRERAAKRWEERTAPERRKRNTKLAALWVAGVVAVGVMGYGIYYFWPEKDVHIHSALFIYVNGERANIAVTDFDLSRTGYLRGHLHTGSSDAVIHVEGAPGLTIGEFFNRGLGGSELGSGFIDLNNAVTPGNVTGRIEDSAELWLLPTRSGEWRQVDGDPADYEFVDLERLILIYGPYTEEQLKSWQDRARNDPFNT